VFDAAREPLAPEAAGWVFRSDAPAPPPPAPRPAADAPRPAQSVSSVDRLLSPVGLALTILLAPLGRSGRPRPPR
jgi:hypothetical protein